MSKLTAIAKIQKATGLTIQSSHEVFDIVEKYVRADLTLQVETRIAACEGAYSELDKPRPGLAYYTLEIPLPNGVVPASQSTENDYVALVGVLQLFMALKLSSVETDCVMRALSQYYAIDG